MSEQNEMDNFKILRTIWKNSFDKILEIKVQNNRDRYTQKDSYFKELKQKTDSNYEKKYQDQLITCKKLLFKLEN